MSTAITMLEAALGATIGGLLGAVFADLFWRSGAMRRILAGLQDLSTQLDDEPPAARRQPAPARRPRSFRPPEWVSTTTTTRTAQPGPPPLASPATPASAEHIAFDVLEEGRPDRRERLSGNFGGWLVGSANEADLRVDSLPSEYLFLQQSGDALYAARLVDEHAGLTIDGTALGNDPVRIRVGSRIANGTVSLVRVQ